MEAVKRNKLVLIILLVVFGFITAWQSYNYVHRYTFSDIYSRKDATGFAQAPAKAFIYFYYNLNIYPVWSSYTPKIDTYEAAKNIFLNHPQTLQMEHSSYVLWGEHAKILLLLIPAMLKGQTYALSLIPANMAMFATSLLMLFSAFVYIKKPVFGLIVVLLLGSNPFQLYEVYANENIFGFNTSLMLVLLALYLPLLANKQPHINYMYVVAILTGVLLGTSAHVRTEAVTVITACIVSLFFSSTLSVARRVKSIVMLLVVYSIVSGIWTLYFDYKYDQAYSLVHAVNTEYPYPQTRGYYHTVWHPMLIGFGDFDVKYGYKWDDNIAYDLARPILLERYPQKFTQLSREAWSVQPEYKQVIREKVIKQVMSDPTWYFKILANRIVKIFTNLPPVNLSLFGITLFSLPIKGFILVFMGVFLVVQRSKLPLYLALFSSSVSLPMLAIHSLYNITNMSTFHIFTFAGFIYTILEFIYHKLVPRMRGHAG